MILLLWRAGNCIVCLVAPRAPGAPHIGGRPSHARDDMNQIKLTPDQLEMFRTVVRGLVSVDLHNEQVAPHSDGDEFLDQLRSDIDPEIFNRFVQIVSDADDRNAKDFG